MARTIRMGIQGEGSSTVHDARVLAGLLKERAGIDLELVMEDNWLRRLAWLRQGKIDLFYEGAATPSRFDGRDPGMLEREMGPLRMHIVASAHSGAHGFMVRGDSPIRRLQDIGPATRVAVCRTTAADTVYGLLAWLKLNIGEVPANPAQGRWNADLRYFNTWEASLRSIGDGLTDVAVATPENPVVKETAARPPGIRFLALPVQEDPEGYARFRHVLPNISVAKAPEEGVREIWGLTTILGTACVWCLPDFDAELDYALTRWLDVNYPLYKDRGNKLRTYTLECLKQVADNAMAPVHAGTVRYLREKNLWSNNNALRQDYFTRVQDLYCEAWRLALTKADQAGVTVAGGNPDWQKLWLNQKQESGLPAIQMMSDPEIREGLMHLGLPVNHG